jgi:rhodanese-related sulfurtransferase
MMRTLFSALLVILLSTVSAWSAGTTGGYNYISAEDVQKRLQSGPRMIVVDICSVEQYSQGHIPGAIETNAYPVKSEEEKTALAKLLPGIQASADDVVIVCPRGGGGAKNTFDFYKSQGVAEHRLRILEKGMENWPYETQGR